MKKLLPEDVANAWYANNFNIARTANRLNLSWKTVNRILVAYFNGKVILPRKVCSPPKRKTCND